MFIPDLTDVHDAKRKRVWFSILNTIIVIVIVVILILTAFVIL